MEKYLTFLARLVNVGALICCASCMSAHDDAEHCFFLPFALAVFYFYHFILLNEVDELHSWRKRRAAVVGLCAAILTAVAMGCCLADLISVKTSMIVCMIGSIAAMLLHHDQEKEMAEGKEVEP
jgi:Na+/H+ antiporter NhaD/arsenite permease-like protein